MHVHGNGANGSIDVNRQDQTTEIIDLHLSRLIQVITIVTNTSIDDTVVTISSAAEPTDGNTVCLKESTAFYQGTILSHAANGPNWDITLDTPLDFAFTTVGGCSERSINLAVNGSVTPVEFSVSPADLTPGTKWDITRMIFQMLDDAAMDDGTFGGIAALTKGVYLRHIDGITKNIFNVKTNGDFAAHMYDIDYSDKAPAGQYGFRARRSFAGEDKNGVVIRLSESGVGESDTLKLVVQDDLSGLISFQAIVQGHVVQD